MRKSYLDIVEEIRVGANAVLPHVRLSHSFIVMLEQGGDGYHIQQSVDNRLTTLLQTRYTTHYMQLVFKLHYYV